MPFKQKKLRKTLKPKYTPISTPGVENFTPGVESVTPLRPCAEVQNSSYKGVFLCSVLFFVAILVIPAAIVQGAPVVFTQSDWNTEDSSSIAASPPFTGWSEHGSKDIGVVNGPDIHLESVNYTMTQTSDDGANDTCIATGCSTAGGFNAGTVINTTVYEAATAANIKLSTTAGNGNLVTNFGPSGIDKSDPGTGTELEEINALAVDATHIYAAGYDSFLGSDQRWRIEKRDITTGALDLGFDTDGIVDVNPNINSDAEQITSIAVDANYVYVAGYASVLNNSLWRIEKRNKVTGTLEPAFDTDGILEVDPSIGSDRINAMAIDATHIYLAGYDNSLGDSQWRIEKRDIISGALVTAFDTDGVVESNQNANVEEINAIAVDATHVYVAGYDSSPGNSQWRIEKRNKVTGALDLSFDTDGIVENNPSTGSDKISAIAIDASHIFVAGQESSLGNTQWRIEKRNITTGALDGGFDTDGIVLNNPSSGSDEIKAIAIDSDYIFAGGYDDSPGNFQWRIECRNISDGSLINAFNTDGVVESNPSANSEEINALVVSGRHLYAAGYENTFQSPKWRIEKRFAREFVPSGTFESPVINLGGIQSFTNFRWLPSNPLPGTALAMEVQAGTAPVSDCPGACSSWGNWTVAVNGTALGAAFDGNQYFKYRASLSTTNPRITSRLDEFVLDFTNFPVGAGLNSSVFDTGDNNTFLKNIAWTETLDGQDVRLQVATSGDNISWNYCGTNACSTSGWLAWNDANNYYTISGDITNLGSSNAINDRYFQYRVWLISDGTKTPSVDDIAITYDTASLMVTGATQTPTAGTPFNITITVKDSSGTNFTDHDGSVTVKLKASTAQPNLGSCTSSFDDAGNTEFSTAGTYSSGSMTISNVVLCSATSSSFTISAKETLGGNLSSTTDLTITTVNLDSGSRQLAFTTQPPPTILAVADFQPAPVISIQDQYGNVDTTDTTAVTIAAFNDNQCSSTPVTGTFNSASLGTVAGVATFSGVNYDKSEKIYLRASGGAFTNVCSSASTIVESGFVVQIGPIYDSTKDAIIITSSLLRNGTLITDFANMSLSSMDITDDTGTSLLSGGLNDPEVTTVNDLVNSIYHTTWDPTNGLVPDKAYSIFSEITYNGTAYQGFKSVSVNQLGVIKSGLQTLDVKIDGAQTTVSGIDTKAGNVNTSVRSLNAKISAQATAQAAYRAQALVKLSKVQKDIGFILEKTSKTLPNALVANISDELAKGLHTEIVTTQAIVRSGAKLPFRFRTASGLKPTITVFDSSDAEKVTSAVMKEVSGTGIYVYNITFETSWGLGEFMVRVKEPTKKSVDHIALQVVEKSSGSSSSGSQSADTPAVSLDTLFSRITNIDNNMDTLALGIDTVKGNTKNVSTDINGLLESWESDTANSLSVAAGNAQKLGKYISSVSSIVGSSGNANDHRTIMGKLNGIETALSELGIEAGAATHFNQTAREKAERIKKFVSLIMDELREEGTVKNAQVKEEILGGYLTELRETVEEIPDSITTGGIVTSVGETLNELNKITFKNEGLKGLVSLAQDDLKDVTEVQSGDELSPEDMLEMRNDVSGLKSLMVEIRGLLDNTVNQPVVHGWLEGE